MLNERGQEVPENNPPAIPVKWRHPPTLQEQIQRMVAKEISEAAANAGHETFEEADDFDVDDEPELKSPYEIDEGLPKFNEKTARTEAIEAAEKRFVKRKSPQEEQSSFLNRLAKALSPLLQGQDPDPDQEPRRYRRGRSASGSRKPDSNFFQDSGY